MLYMFRTVLVHLQEQLYKLYIAFGICRYVWLLCGCSQTYATRIYQMRCTVYKVAPDDGLIQSETCKAFNWKIKSNHKNSVRLVGLYTYRRMMHGAYNVKLHQSFLSGLMELDFSPRQVFQTYKNIKFHEIRHSERRVAVHADRRTERQTRSQ